MGGEGYGVATGESLGARSCRQGLRKKNRRKKSEVILYSVMDSTTHLLMRRVDRGRWALRKLELRGHADRFLGFLMLARPYAPFLSGPGDRYMSVTWPLQGTGPLQEGRKLVRKQVCGASVSCEDVLERVQKQAGGHRKV